MKRLTKLLFLGALPLLTAFPSLAQVAAPISVFTEGLTGGWEDWSWSSGQSVVSSPVHGGQQAIKATQAAWGGLFFRTPPTSFSGNESVTFWIHGGASGGQQLQLQARDASGNPMPGVALPSAPVANQWKQYTVALSALGVSTQQITGFVIQNYTASTAPTYYVDDFVINPLPIRQSIFADAGANGWTLGGTANMTVNAATTSPVRGGSKSIAATPSANWAYFGLDKAGANLSGYEKLEFWAHGGAAGGQQLDVQAFRNGQKVGSSYLPALKAGQWTRQAIPLSSLNPSNGLIDTIAIFYPDGASGKKFYLDDIALLRKLGPSDATSMKGLKVSGNKLQNGQGQTLFIHGGNISQTGFLCAQGHDTPLGGQAFVDAAKAWNINAVRVPLNEQCWLGINGNAANSSKIGQPYRTAITDFVNLLTENNLAVIVDLHYAMPGAKGTEGLDLQPMPNADHSPAFWTSVANTFKTNSSVIFDIYNEPYVLGAQTEAQKWNCWKNGGAACSVKVTEGIDTEIGPAYAAVGMQSLVNTVRATGATNVVMVGGLNLAGNLKNWNAYKPADATGNLMASSHQYNFAWCGDAACWATDLAPVMDVAPVIVGEFGVRKDGVGGCSTSYNDQLMSLVESKKQGYMAWTFNDLDGPTGKCTDSNFDFMLLDNVNGMPSDYGMNYYKRLRNLPGTHP